MAITTEATDTFPIFHIQITDEHAIVLPPELRQRLGVGAGDVVAISAFNGQAFVSKVPKAKAMEPIVYEEVPEAEGLLRDYFTDHGDVMRFIEEERRG